MNAPYCSLTPSELTKLKQMLCSHKNKQNYDLTCTCCDEFHYQLCLDCGKIITTDYALQCKTEHDESDDGYCNMCS